MSDDQRATAQFGRTIFDLTAAAVKSEYTAAEQAIRDKLIELGWTPPEMAAPVQALRDALEKPAYTHALALQNIREALELVLRWIDDWCETGPETGFDLIEEKVNAALAEQQAAEPVGTVESAMPGTGGFHARLADGAEMPAVGTKLYIQASAQQSLTDDEIAEMMRQTWGCASIAPRHAPAFARAIEAAHGITGSKTVCNITKIPNHQP